jgi:hypothetical protein
LGGIGVSIQTPHWLLALVLGAIAACTSAKRPYRFSLRTLLIATTLVGVALGLIAWAR